MAKRKKEIEQVLPKVVVREQAITLMAHHPTEIFNYKEVASRLHVKSMEMKRQISNVLRDLAHDGLVEEISMGRYKFKQLGS